MIFLILWNDYLTIFLYISIIFCTFAPEFVKWRIVSTALTKLSPNLRLKYHPPWHDQPTNKTMADIEQISTQQLDTPFKSDEYKELLLQAVAVIESARFRLARQVAATSNDTYWEIGKLLYDRKLESKHGSQIVMKLSACYIQRGTQTRSWIIKRGYLVRLLCHLPPTDEREMSERWPRHK